MNNHGRLVYSSDFGAMCPDCRRPKDHCRCKSTPRTFATDGVVRLRRETKGRKGKGVTLVTGVPLNSEELAKLGKELKKKCGSGGTVKDGVIEIQGDHRDTLLPLLEAKGWVVKKAGG